jgi:hypothetical protein
MRPITLPLAALLLTAPLAACQAAGTRVTNVVGIDVAEGVNDIQRFAPDGRQALVVEGRRSGPDSAPVFFVMLPRSAPAPGWDVVGVAGANGQLDLASAGNPGLTRTKAVRFARAKVGGLPATLMFVANASRDTGRYDITIYRLVTDGEDGSGLNAVFDPLRTFSPSGTYCSPGQALDASEDLTPEPGDSCRTS